jgi:hypothetical protein
MSGSSGAAYVCLRGPLAVPLEALRLLWELEARGCALRADGDDLWVTPRESLTDGDRHRIRQWKPFLVALVRYTPDDLAAVASPAVAGALAGAERS